MMKAPLSFYTSFYADMFRSDLSAGRRDRIGDLLNAYLDDTGSYGNTREFKVYLPTIACAGIGEQIESTNPRPGGPMELAVIFNDSQSFDDQQRRAAQAAKRLAELWVADDEAGWWAELEPWLEDRGTVVELTMMLFDLWQVTLTADYTKIDARTGDET